MTPLRTRAIEVLEEAIGEWSRRLVPDRYVDPPTLVEVQVDALLAAGLLHDPTCEARIERAARDLLMDALGAIYDLGGCDGTCGTTGQCVAKRIRAYLADDHARARALGRTLAAMHRAGALDLDYRDRRDPVYARPEATA